MKRGLILTGLATALVSLMALTLSAGEAAKAPAVDVLIIYASGTPEGGQADAGAAVQTTTLPTPRARNVKTLSESLGEALKAKGLAVRVVETGDIKDGEEVKAAKALVLGSPVYFSNVSWRMARLLDETFYPIFSTREKLSGKPVAGIAMGGGEGGAKSVLDIMQRVVESCGGKWGPVAAFSGRTSDEDAQRMIGELADGIAAKVKPAQ